MKKRIFQILLNINLKINKITMQLLIILNYKMNHNKLNNPNCKIKMLKIIMNQFKII